MPGWTSSRAVCWSANVSTSMVDGSWAVPRVIPTPTEALLLITTVLTMPVGYFGVTAAMRVGDIAVVTPFRYSRIVFALILAALVFGERPDALTYLGAAIIVGSGLYTIWREARLNASNPS